MLVCHQYDVCENSVGSMYIDLSERSVSSVTSRRHLRYSTVPIYLKSDKDLISQCIYLIIYKIILFKNILGFV